MTSMNGVRRGVDGASDPIVVVLAAGRSSRMGRAKALIELDGERALARVLRLAREQSLRAQVVLGHGGDAIRAALDLRDVDVIENPDPARGMSSSIRCGALALPAGAALALWPVDHARVEAATFARLLAAFRARAPGIELVVPRHRDRRGHPLLASARAVDEFRALAPDEPGHVVVRRDPARVAEVVVDDRMVVDDFDRPEDLAR
ncbi:MAG: NTP transferase domain-containing protein [Planctomycetes bacterium]|nr:NTP transferase domain-containing protein [Planctomycetota bacterium]